MNIGIGYIKPLPMQFHMMNHINMNQYLDYKERVKNGEWSPHEALLKMQKSFLDRGISLEVMYETRTYKWLVRKIKESD